MLLRSLALSAILSLGAGAASAATLGFDFLNPGATQQGESLTFAEGGTTLTVRSIIYRGSYRLQDDASAIDWSSTGLGVLGQDGGDPLVDGDGKNNAVLFDFGDEEVRIESLTFTHLDDGDRFELYLFDENGEAERILRKSVGVDERFSRTFVFDEAFTASRFAIGARGKRDEFRIGGINQPIAAVPLPGSALLLLAGLAGFGVLRRKA